MLRMLQNKALGQIFGRNRAELKERRRMHTEESHDMYSSPNIIRLTYSKRNRWAGI